MSKVAVVFWSGTGNTETMAEAIAEGAKNAGAETCCCPAGNCAEETVLEFDAIAFGCPSMGDEILEEDEFQPMWDSIKTKLGSKKVAIFGSYGWGDGEWMRNWEEECNSLGINLVQGGLMLNEAPDDAGIEECKALGAALA